MSATATDSRDFLDLSDQQQLQALSERKLGKKQLELGEYLMAELGKDAGDVVAILDAIREFNANYSSSSSTGERVSVAQKVIQDLQADRDRYDEEDPAPHPNVLNTYDRCISIAGRFV